MSIQDDDQDNAAMSEDDGLYYPFDYVIETYDVFNNFGVMPEPGGYNDQDPHWWHDIRTIRRRLAHIKRNLKEDKDESDALNSLLYNNADKGVGLRDLIHD